MRKIILLFITAIISFTGFSQELSNKGKDFWVGYGYHQVMGATGGGNNGQNMVLYFATEAVTTVTVSIPGNGYTQTFANIPANTIFTTPIMPKNGPQDARLYAEGLSDRGIHIVSSNPIVAYAHIYNASVSGACLLFPTNTLGKEYYSINYTNRSNTTDANSWFYVVATDPGITTVEIVPSAATSGGWAAGQAYTVTLTQGQVYTVKGDLEKNPPLNCNPFCSGEDLTGSSIKSIASGTGGCKRIAVYSGSGRIAISCNNTAPSSDNYMVQAFPKTAWGKRYLTASTGGNMTNNIYRVCVAAKATIVKINGVVTTLPLINNFYYEIPATSQPQLIEADNPILVAQYVTSQGVCGNGSPGDPEVIYLSSVEQNIDNVIFNSNLLVAATPHNHLVNVIIPNGGTGVSSFRIDGLPPAGAFTVHPQDPAYSYIKIPNLALGQHVIQSDSGFNAIAYGFAAAESYGYNAGTNVRDLNQQLEISTEFGIESTPSVCVGTPFKFKAYFPVLQVPPAPFPYFDSVRWNCTSPAVSPNNFPITISTLPDSTNIRNGKSVNWYSLPGFYNFTTPGTYTVTVTTYKSTTEGCGSEQDYDFQVVVSNPPAPSFTATQPGCYLEPVQFTETTPQIPKATYKWFWDFGDGTPYSFIKDPQHTYTAPGTYTARYSAVTTPGCISDTVSVQVVVPDVPSAIISGDATVCINDPAPLSVTFTATGGRSPYEFTYSINNAPDVTITTAIGVSTVTIPVSTNVAGTFNYYLRSVKNLGSTLCTQLQPDTVVVTVLPDATVALSSAPGTDNQTVCINTAIVNIAYAVGGSGTGAAVTGLPAGVTGTYAGGTITIVGTPTVSGTFSYTVSTTGPCVKPTLSGTLTVTADGTLALSSAAGTDNQTVCINTPVSTILYTAGGSLTGGTVTGLPAGVTGTYAGGVITILGSPSIAGTFNYTITTNGPCIKPSATGTLTVTADATLSLSSPIGTDNQTVCINTPFANITYAVGGTGTGGSVTGLPAGVTGTYAAGVITITGTPTASGIFNYTVNTTGPCVKPTATGTLTVTADGTLTLNSAPGSDVQTVCINTPVSNIVYASGGSLNGASLTGLPAGVTFTYSAGVITLFGTPTVAGTFNYTVNTTGPCVKPTATGTITVTGDATLALSSAPGSNTQTICINNAISTITYAVGGTGTGGSVSGLPAGVTGTYAGGVITITGIPTASGVFNYTVNTTGPCAKPTATGTLTVTADGTLSLNSGVGTDNQTVCINTPVSNIIYIAGGSLTGATVTGLPTGVTGIYTGGVITISGSPSVAGTFNYTLNTTGPCVKPTATGTITVTADATLALTSAAGTNIQTVCENNAITTITYAVGGTGTGGSVTGLPAGVTGTYAGGVITIQGTPSATGTFNFIVNTTGPCAKPTATGTLTVSADATLALTSAAGTDNQAVCINTVVTNIVYSIGGGGTGATVTGLPAGVTGTYAAGLLTIQGSPSVTGIFNYTITTTGPCIKPTATGSITITGDATLNLSSAPGTNTQTVCVNNAIANITYAVGGTGTGGNVAGLPAGITGTYAAGVITITGTPTATGTFNYTVTTTGPCVKPTATGTLTISADATIALSSAAGTDNQAVCINTAITNITYAIGGGGTGGSVTGLPAGISGSYTGGIVTITGTPTVSGAFNYTVNTNGPCIKPSATGSITINPLPTALISGNIEVCQNAASPGITFTGANGTAPYTFTYSVNGGADQTITTTIGNSVTVLQPTATAGTYTYLLKSVNESSATSCSQLQNGTVSVKVNPLPTALISGTTLICINTASQGITFTGANGTAPYTFRYRINGGALQTITTTGTNTAVTVPVATNAAGVFNYTLEDVRDGSSTTCLQAQTGNATITISNVFPNPAFAFSDPVCLPNALVQFQNQTTIADGSSMTYLWNFGDGSATSTAFQPSHTYSSVGPFNVLLQATSNAGCVTTIPIAVNSIHAQPKAAFSISKPAGVCIGDDVVLTDLTDAKDGVVAQWNWDLGDGTTVTTNPITYKYASAKTYSITLFTVNSFGCNSDTITQSFTVHPYPVVDAGPDGIVLEGGSYTMQPTVTGNDLQYLWSPSTYLNSTTIAAPTANIMLNDITYKLVVTGRGGCEAAPDYVFIKVLKAPQIPNTFTPNGDGINELWLIDYLDTYPNCKVQVFTRTGQLVFESKGYKTPWNGKFNGKPLPFDTYYYIIEPENGRKPMTGYVTIVK